MKKTPVPCVQKLWNGVFVLFIIYSLQIHTPSFTLLKRLHNLDDWQVQKCQSVYSQKLSEIQCLNCEEAMKRRYGKYQCQKYKACKEGILHIFVIEESSCKEDSAFRFTVITMYQTGKAKNTKRHCAGKAGISSLITNHKRSQRNQSDYTAFNSDSCKECLCQNRFAHWSWFFFHNRMLIRLQSKGNRRKTICQKVDKQKMYCCKWHRHS